MKFLSRITPNAAILILLAACLAVGVFTAADYGLSWDEPLFYAYADAIPSAYNLSARLSGDFALEDTYGPSSDHGRYGPAYLLFAKPVKDALLLVPGVDAETAWHLLNFITFLAGAGALYLLLTRWVPGWYAVFGAALYITQPVLWGHGFMNPKDTPFTSFFIFALYAGLKLVDSAHSAPKPVTVPVRLPGWLWVLTGGAAIAGLGTLLFSNALTQAAQALLDAAYQQPQSLFGQFFSLLTVNARNAPLDVYQIKIAALVKQLPLVFFALALLGGTLAIIAMRAAAGAAKAWEYLFSGKAAAGRVWIAGILLGMVTSIRVLGPLAGTIIALILLIKLRGRGLALLGAYALIGFTVAYITWPYLWGAPVDQFLSVLLRSADNPERVRLLFDGVITYSDELPRTYLFTMMGLTLTLPALALAALGLTQVRRLEPALVIGLWLGLPLAYVLASNPPLYDGFRHFTFITPALFALATIGAHAAWMLLEKVHVIASAKWLRATLAVALLLPGMIGIVQLHPYHYTYYNAVAGGVGGAFRTYETDYWLTCYKEAIAFVNADAPDGANLFTFRNLLLTAHYARDGVNVGFYDTEQPTPPNSYILYTTRTNVDQLFDIGAPVAFEIGRLGASFCIVEKTP